MAHLQEVEEREAAPALGVVVLAAVGGAGRDRQPQHDVGERHRLRPQPAQVLEVLPADLWAVAAARRELGDRQQARRAVGAGREPLAGVLAAGEEGKRGGADVTGDAREHVVVARAWKERQAEEELRGDAAERPHVDGRTAHSVFSYNDGIVRPGLFYYNEGIVRPHVDGRTAQRDLLQRWDCAAACRRPRCAACCFDVLLPHGVIPGQ